MQEGLQVQEKAFCPFYFYFLKIKKFILRNKQLCRVVSAEIKCAHSLRYFEQRQIPLPTFLEISKF